jgi:hypothetical protein
LSAFANGSASAASSAKAAAPIRSAAAASSVLYLPLVNKYYDSAFGTLANGGTYVGAGGVALGALSDSLSAPIGVVITPTLAPTLTMPASLQVLSGYYQVSASAPVSLSTASPLILAFPVPTGADTTHLALAVFMPNAGVLDALDNFPTWTFLEGQYDPAQHLFLTTLASLDPAGMVIALVHDPDLASPPNTAALAKAGANRPNSGPQFAVQCVNFTKPDECTPTTVALVEDALSEVYARLHDHLSFLPLRLRFMDGTLTYNPNSLSSLGYAAYLEPTYSGLCHLSALSYYEIAPGRLVLCLDPAAGLSPIYHELLAHEFFHAIQYGYLPVFADWYTGAQEPWIIEGTATAAMKSYALDEMIRMPGLYSLHAIDVPLTDRGTPTQLNQYSAQDFWVYAGKHDQHDLFYLQNVFNLGATTPDVANALDSGQRLELYWLWAKNQAMEATNNFDGALTSPCVHETSVVKQLQPFNYVWGATSYYTFTLQPLQSALIKINFDHNYQGADAYGYAVNFTDPNAAASMRYKFYKDGESGCETIPDGERIFSNLKKTDGYYAVVSNVDIDQAFDYLIGLETSSPSQPSR